MNSEVEFRQKVREAVSALADSRGTAISRRQKWETGAPRILAQLDDWLRQIEGISAEYNATSRVMLIWFGANYPYPEANLLEDGAALAIGQDQLSGLLGVAHVGFEPCDLGNGPPKRSAPIHDWIEPDELAGKLPDLIIKFLGWALRQSPTSKPRKQATPATETPETPETKAIEFTSPRPGR